MKGRVIKSTGSWYKVMIDEDKLVDARIKGKFRLKGIKTTNPIAVGDFVELEMEEDETWVIHHIAPRRNQIVRKSTNLSKQSHIIASNVDQAVLVVSVASPPTSAGFIDRFLVAAEAYEIPTVIIFNKIDLLDKDGLAELKQRETLYENLGYQTHSVSCLVEEDMKTIKSLFKDQVSLLAGHSGAGKSTLANEVEPGLELRTGDVSDYHQKGMHTTTFAEMVPLSMGGFIVDSPGIKGFGLVGIEKDEIALYFRDLKASLSDCKFYNCKHLNEPGCAVLKKVEKGSIAQSRYNSYCAMMEDDENQSYR